MIIQYTLTEKDYVQSNIDYIKFSDSFKKQINLIKIGTAAVLFLGSLLIVKGTIGVGVGAVLAVLECLFFEKYYAFTTGRKIKKSMTNEDLLFYTRGVNLITTPYGFTIEGKGKKLRYKWSEISVIGESKDRIYLFTENGISEIIPKRDQDQTALRTEIIDKILVEGKAVLKSI